ncbi:OPT oligopeptide transporter protein-domain-containing protein [Dipodascopsis tothii]|uniref:OPT oligopeptide transporter protein-domain-containing protein n=1 Tax=Dipodascopsis tothii TaxID=44089 RepID=UPI0034CFFADF
MASTGSLDEKVAAVEGVAEVDTESKDQSFSSDYEISEKTDFILHSSEAVIDRIRAAGDMDDILVDDSQFFVEKIRLMSPVEAREVLLYAVSYHEHDVNFPTATMNRIKELLLGENVYGKGDILYDLDLRLEASLIKFHSPYPEVRAVVSPTDDTSIPVETFRAYTIGIFWVCVGAFINQLIYFRQPHFTLSAQVIMLLTVPCGQFAAKYLPAWKFKIWKWTVNLNPGPWSFKEQMFTTIITNVGSQSCVWGQYAPVVREDLFYGQAWATFGFNLLMNFSTQLFGLGLAGIMRRWAVYPSKALWPTILPTLQLNRTLLVPESKKNINGWTISKYKLFNILLAGSFVYFFIPDYLFTALSTFNWMTWIAPTNKNLAFVTGSKIGAGFNPIPSFDWSVINYATPQVLPFFTYANKYFGAVVGAIVMLIMYYTNYKFTSYIPPNTSNVYDRYGASYSLTKVLKNNKLDATLYHKYSPPYISAGNLMYTCVAYANYTFAFVYILATEWRTFRDAVLGFVKGLKNRKSSNYADYRDPISKMMQAYKEVPDWWFFIIFAISLIFACVAMRAYPTDTPVWTVIVVLLAAIALLVPFMVLYSSTGFFLNPNMLGTILGGYLVPGSGLACLFLRTFGYVIENQSETYVGDQKLGHYAKLPPRAVFRGQAIATILSVFITSGALEFAHTLENFCSYTQSARFYCAWSHSIYSETVLFGVIGPSRTFDHLYPTMRWSFLIGACIAIPMVLARPLLHKYFKGFHPVLFLGGFQVWGSNYNLSYYTGGFYLSFAFMYYLRTRYLAWWARYNYIIYSGVSAGVAFSGILIFLALQYHPKTLTWWGNSISGSTADGLGVATLKDVPAIGYFGGANGTWV